MKPRILLAIGAAAFCVAVDDLPDYDERTLELSAPFVAEMTINTVPARLQVVPDSASIPTINGDAAERFDFDPSMIRFAYVLGGETLEFTTDVARYEMGSGRFRRRSAFAPMELSAIADGEIGPGGLPFGKVVYRLGEEQPGEAAHVFEMADRGRGGAGVMIDLDGHDLFVGFSVTRPESLLTATAGAVVARVHGGYFSGEPTLLPIRYGVERPARGLTLESPLMLGQMPVRSVAVRTADFGDASNIGDAPEVRDPNEIVVTAENSDDLPPLRLVVGLDTIGHCSSLIFDFEEETVTLMCPDQAGLPL